MFCEEQQLVRQAIAGQRQAFGELTRHYRPLVHGLVLSSTRHSDEAEELVQEVFCRAFEELDCLRQPEMFGAWLRRIASNTTISWWRRQQRGRRAKEAYALQAEWEASRPDELYDRAWRAEVLREALGRLEYNYRRVLMLYYWENCSYQKIACVLGVPISTVKWRLLKGRNKLRSYLN